MIIGNIVTKSLISAHDRINVVDSLDNIIEGLPTLIIGWDIVKTINPNADYTDRVLSNNIRWTFNLIERRNLYEIDLYYFIESCYKNLISNINYKYIDFILLSDTDIVTIFNDIKNSKKNIAFKNDNMVFIYAYNTIYGINLDIVEFVGRDSNKLINYLKTFVNVFLESNDILIEYKGYMDKLNNQSMYIPYLYSIENE